MDRESFGQQGYQIEDCPGNVFCGRPPHPHAILARGMRYCPFPAAVIVDSTVTPEYGVILNTDSDRVEFTRHIQSTFEKLHPDWLLNIVVFKGGSK